MQEHFWKINRQGHINEFTHLPHIDVMYFQDKKLKIGQGVRYGLELKVTNEELLNYKLILTNTNKRVAEVWLEGTRLVIKGLEPGKVEIRIFVEDDLFRFITGDPEEDNPLVIDVEIV